VDIKTISKLVRFKEIVTTLLKYGFDDLVQRLDLPGMELIRKLRASDHRLSTHERVRFMLEDLGPTFVKFGQIMSLRPDLLPPPLLHELSKLQDEVTPVEMDQIKPVVEAGLRRPLEEVFSIFDVQPLAAASLSQVHKAVLRKEGKIVCVKVQRPGIRRKIKSDLDILEAIVTRLHEGSEDLKTYNLPNLVRVIRRYLLQEIDFAREARNMRIARSFAKDGKDISIPEVHEDYCSERLLVMEYIHGARLKDVDVNSLVEAESLAKDGLRAAIRQILEDGFFHADPHPGNLLLTEENRLCLVDWGMVGRLTERDRYEILDLIRSVVEKDSESLLDTLLVIADEDYQIDRRGLERRLLDILDSYFALPLKEMRIGRLLLDITNLLREYRLG
jgi:ubiquinone biosynthesis protein